MATYEPGGMPDAVAVRIDAVAEQRASLDA
jgi:hypothetical protein